MSEQRNLNPTGEESLDLYERMLLIRSVEDRLRAESAAGNLPGAVHLYIGEEAIAVGVCARLQPGDWITSTHRGHGHFLAKGGDPTAMMAEIWGKRTGICRGMGGSMHVADFSKGILGANGIVGGGFAIATGAAFAAKLRGEARVSAVFFGDGAANQGVFMECLNVSSLWKLPVVFVCENNRFSEFTVSSTVISGELADRARAFKIPCHVIDGNDVIAVWQAAGEAIDHARNGNGPVYIEANTYRIQGHFEAEDLMLGGGKYREKDEIELWRKEDKDPIARFRKQLLAGGKALQAIEAKIAEVVETAVREAEAAEPADAELAFELMFVGQKP
jgi:TPP-dependent pyruvate/acetoin dehydrogenase alpha subunit